VHPSSCGTFFKLCKNNKLKEKELLLSESTVTETIHETSVMLIANTANWRKVAKELIGDEPVDYMEKSKKDTLRKRPIVTLFSTDPEALKRVLTKAAEVE
jgi:hypothetical protein